MAKASLSLADQLGSARLSDFLKNATGNFVVVAHLLL